MKKRGRGGEKKKPLMRWFSMKAGVAEFRPDNVQMSVQQTLCSQRADVLNALIKSAAAAHVFLLLVRAREVEP